MDALYRISSTEKIDKKMKKSLSSKMKNVTSSVETVEKSSGLNYPPYYVEPVLTVAESGDDFGGLGVLYARTIPVESEGSVQIVVQLSAALVLYAAKATIKLVMAHEFLHYLELVRNFTRMDLVSQTTSGSIYEEVYMDSSRAIEPARVFPGKRKLIKDLSTKASEGLDDEKLNEKCRENWIEKGLPMVRIPLARNQTKISVEAIARSTFDPKVREFVSKL